MTEASPVELFFHKINISSSVIPPHKWSIFFADIISVDALDKYYARESQDLITTPYTGTMPSLTESDAIVRTISS